jgi:hypothetical protein
MQAVEGVLTALVSGAPPQWRLVVDDATGSGSCGEALAVVFHLQDGNGRQVPLSNGIAFYRLNQVGGCSFRLPAQADGGAGYRLPAAL